MRTIPAMTLDNDRELSAAFTLRRQKQAWDTIVSTDPSAWSYDADNYSTGILRVAVVSGTLRFQYTAAPTGAWGAWTDSTVTADADKHSVVQFYYDGADFHQISAANHWA